VSVKNFHQLCPYALLFLQLQPNSGLSEQSENYSSPISNVSTASPKANSVQPIPLALNEDDFASDIDDATEILHNLKLSFDQTEDPAMDTRYFGKSSSAMMIKAAIDFKNDLLGESGRPISSIFSDIMSRRPSIWRIPSVGDFMSSFLYFSDTSLSGSSGFINGGLQR
jgi:hypothetical protein